MSSIISAVVGCGYAVDSDGNVYGKSGRKLKPYKMKNGYYYVRLHLKDRSITATVHKLIYESFFGKIFDENLVVHHKDHDKLNNKLENLELVTREENTCINFSSGLQMTIGNKYKNSCRVFTTKDIKELKYLKSKKYTNKYLAKYFGVSTRTISRYLNDKHGRKAILENG